VRSAAVRVLRLGWSTLLATAIQSSIDGSARRVSRDQLLRIIYPIAGPRRIFGNCRTFGIASSENYFLFSILRLGVNLAFSWGVPRYNSGGIVNNAERGPAYGAQMATYFRLPQASSLVIRPAAKPPVAITRLVSDVGLPERNTRHSR